MLTIPMRQFLLAALLLGCALATGWLWAYFGPLWLLLLVALSMALVQMQLRITPEAFLLGLLTAGYILGNRGFAQLNLAGIFIGEFVLILCAAAGLWHLTASQHTPYRANPLAGALVIWIGLMLLRLLQDFPEYRMLAIRDAAMVYYAIFFFVGQAIARHGPSINWYREVIQWSALAMAPFYLWFSYSPESLLRLTSAGGFALVLYKGDLAALYLGVAYLMFLEKSHRTGQRTLLIPACICLAMMLYTTNRAVLPGFLFASGLLYLAGYRATWTLLPRLALLSLIPLLIWLLWQGNQLHHTRLYAIYEHVISLFDWGGNYHYRSPTAQGTGENNQFRLVWWATVLQETWRQAPWWGLGFGYDLSQSFVTIYFGEYDSFTARSPHSILLTTFGRQGLIGLAVLVGILLIMLRATLQTLRHSRKNNTTHPALIWWALVWLGFSSAAFGVVLEGPMAGIPFWTWAGIAYTLAQDTGQQESPPHDRRIPDNSRLR